MQSQLRHLMTQYFISTEGELYTCNLKSMVTFAQVFNQKDGLYVDPIYLDEDVEGKLQIQKDLIVKHFKAVIKKIYVQA